MESNRDQFQIELVIDKRIAPETKALVKEWVEFMDEYRGKHNDNCTLLVRINQ